MVLMVALLGVAGATDVQADGQFGFTIGSGSSSIGAESFGSGADTGKFTLLLENFQQFALVLLCIGSCIAGLMFMIGKTEHANHVLIGAIVVCGGGFVVGLVKDALVGNTDVISEFSSTFKSE